MIGRRALSRANTRAHANAQLTSNLSNMDRHNLKTIRLTDPRALRAYAHPLRLALIGVLRREGPLTATRAGELLGGSPASCSFHLRQLAKYGLVEEAGRPRGRERPWRATALYTRLPRVAGTPEHEQAARLLYRVLAERFFDEVMRWVARRSGEPRAWQRVAHFGDDMLYLTAGELGQLKRRIYNLLTPYHLRTAEPERRPPGARRVTFLHLALPAEETPRQTPARRRHERRR